MTTTAGNQVFLRWTAIGAAVLVLHGAALWVFGAVLSRASVPVVLPVMRVVMLTRPILQARQPAVAVPMPPAVRTAPRFPAAVRPTARPAQSVRPVRPVRPVQPAAREKAPSRAMLTPPLLTAKAADQPSAPVPPILSSLPSVQTAEPGHKPAADVPRAPAPVSAPAPASVSAPAASAKPESGGGEAAAARAAAAQAGSVSTAGPGGEAAQAQGAVVLSSSDAVYRDNPQPRYPQMSQMLGESGTVVLLVLVGTDGRAQAVHIKKPSPYPRLDESARRTVQERWRFWPGTVGGVPKAGLYEVPIIFKLEN